MGSIFISYRREDTEGHAGRLLDELKKCVGKDCIFFDVENIRPGVNFRQVIQAQLASCDVMLVVIGKRWTELKDLSGARRIDNKDDVVRLEIATALNRGIPVVPVLVQGAILPMVLDLPDDLKPLAERNGYELRHNKWNSDVKDLIATLVAMVPGISQIAPENFQLTAASSTARFIETKPLFTNISLLVFTSSILVIGVAYEILYMILDWHDAFLFLSWLAIGLSMGIWHATRLGINLVRDVILGFSIALGSTLIISLDGFLFYKQPFWPQTLAEWQYTVKHLTMIMASFILGGSCPLLRKRIWRWKN